MKTLGIVGLSLALLCIAPACDKDTIDKPAASATELKRKSRKLTAPSLFKKIPADAIFVFANYERLDADYVEFMARLLAPLVQQSKAQLAEEVPEAKQFMKEHGDIFTLAGLKKIGINTRPFFAMYNHDLSFVIRLELEDGKALLQFIDKLIVQYGEGDPALASKAAGGMRYWEAEPDEEAAFIVGIDQNELVMALMPQSAKEKLKPYILGQKAPAKNITDSGALLKVVAENGGPQGVGFLDAKAGLQLLVNGAEGLQGSDLDLSDMNKICKDEFRQLVDMMPRIIFGYDRLDSEEISMYYGVELRDDIAKRLAKVFRPVPGYAYTKTSKPPFVAGLGVNVGEAMAWGADVSKKIKQSPYQCEDLRELNSALTQADDGAAIVVPLIRDITGFLLILETIDIDAPLNMSGMFAIGNNDVGALVGAAKAMVPGMSGLNLKVGEEPIQIDNSVASLPVDVFAARGEKMVGAAIGSSRKNLKGLVSSKESQEGPFFVVQVDYPTIARLMEERGMADSEISFLSKLGDIALEGHTQKSGMVFRYRATLK